jgi:hypothetical protein
MVALADCAETGGAIAINEIAQTQQASVIERAIRFFSYCIIEITQFGGALKMAPGRKS